MLFTNPFSWTRIIVISKSAYEYKTSAVTTYGELGRTCGARNVRKPDGVVAGATGKGGGGVGKTSHYLWN